MNRKRRIALLDPVEEIAYSRPARKGHAGYQEDTELQALMDNKGLESAKAYAMARYQGVMVAVMA